MNNPEFVGRFKGMALMNPTLSISEGSSYINERKKEGFVSIRFNPYLWPEGELMSDERGASFYATAGDLKLPVAFMCFQGLPLHYTDIVTLLKAYPSTTAIIDHWGFFKQEGKMDENSWKQLISLASYSQVYVKVSALFRVSLEEWPYMDLDAKFVELKEAFGADRLLWGSDYPYVTQECGYKQAISALSQWKKSEVLNEDEWKLIFRGTAESLFGPWVDHSCDVQSSKA